MLRIMKWSSFYSLIIWFISDPVTMAPEVFLLDSGLLVEGSGSRRRTMSSSEETDLLNPSNPANVDCWSLGVVLLQVIAVSHS